MAPSHAVETTSIEESSRYIRKWWDLLRENALGRGLWYGFTWSLELAVRLLVGAPLRRFSQIYPDLFVGGQHRRRGWLLLKRWGVHSVVNMRIEHDDAPAGLAPERYLHLPTVDGTPPTIENLSRGVRFIERERDQGRGVYVHCEAGVGRAVTMAAAYLIYSEDLKPQQAWHFLRGVRPFMRPTRSQREQIERFARDHSSSVPVE